MPENAPEYSIARDYDPYNEILSAESDPMAAYLTYLAELSGIWVSPLRISKRTSLGLSSGDG